MNIRGSAFLPSSAIRLVPLAILLIFHGGHPCGNAIEPILDNSVYRQPIALALTQDDRWLLTANRKSGSVSIIDLVEKKVVREVTVGKRLASLVLSVDERTVFVADEGSHQLLIMDWKEAGGPMDVRSRIAVAPYPVSVICSRNGRRAYVSSLWSRCVTVVSLDGDNGECVTQAIDLPFAPRCQLLTADDSRLLIADSFGGRIGIIDTETTKLSAVRTIPAHNIRGLAVSADGSMLLIAHQMLNDFAHSDLNDVHWGLMMSNDLRWVRLDRFLDGAENLFEGGHMHPLGHAGSATADPSGLAVAHDGSVVVALGGVGEVATGKEGDFGLERMRVGRRPTAAVTTHHGHAAIVANTLSDSVTLLDLPGLQATAEIPLGVLPELSSAERGERLFYDAKLSHDGWMSCHSCHSDGHTNGQLNDNFSDGSFGAAKRVLSLFDCGDTGPYAWNGAMPSLEKQIRNSVTKTMQRNEEPTAAQVSDLAAFLRSLKNPESIDELRGQADAESISQGKELFSALRCNGCHVPPRYTSDEAYDVGLEDKLGNTEFNPPSLRGVGHREPYFHDNRAATLREVFTKFRHQLPRELNDAELDSLVKFLRSL